MFNERSKLLSPKDGDMNHHSAEIQVDRIREGRPLSYFINRLWNKGTAGRQSNKQQPKQHTTLQSHRLYLVFVGLLVAIVWCIATTSAFFVLTSSSLSIPTNEDYQIAMEQDGSSKLSLLSNFMIALDVRKAQKQAKDAMTFLSSSSAGTTFDYLPDVSSIKTALQNTKDFATKENVVNDNPVTNDDDAAAAYGDDVSTWKETDISDALNISLLGKSLHDENGSHHKLHKGCEATVMIVRHCEKSSVREHCDYVGYERSVYFASLFGDKYHSDRWPLPSYLLAANPAGRDNKNKLNLREIELLAPLSEKAKVPIDDTYFQGEEITLAKAILTNMKTGNLCGKLIVISWKHSLIGHLAHKLGCGPKEGCPVDYKGKVFDDVWQIKYVYRIPRHSLRKSLKLEKVPKWYIYGSVQHENFDPLHMSFQYGDYVVGGTKHGGRWETEQISYPERKRKKGITVWHPTAVGFGS